MSIHTRRTEIRKSSRPPVPHGKTLWMLVVALLIAAVLVMMLLIGMSLAATSAGAQTITDAVTREVTVLNDTRSLEPAPANATSRELTAYNDLRAIEEANATNAASRELTAYNDLRAIEQANPTNAASRELTAYNDLHAIEAAGLSNAASREFTLLNDSRLFEAPPSDAITREFTVAGSRFSVTDVRDALRIAAGMAKATVADMTRLDIVASVSSTNLINTQDAVRLMRIFSGLDP